MSPDAGKAVEGQAAVQAAPAEAKASNIDDDRVKRIAKADMPLAEGLSKKSLKPPHTECRRGRKIGEESVVENVATGKAKRAKRGGIAQKVGASEVVSNKEKDAAYAKESINMASDAAAGDAAHKQRLIKV